MSITHSLISYLVTLFGVGLCFLLGMVLPLWLILTLGALLVIVGWGYCNTLAYAATFWLASLFAGYGTTPYNHLGAWALFIFAYVFGRILFQIQFDGWKDKRHN